METKVQPTEAKGLDAGERPLNGLAGLTTPKEAPPKEAPGIRNPIVDRVKEKPVLLSLTPQSAPVETSPSTSLAAKHHLQVAQGVVDGFGTSEKPRVSKVGTSPNRSSDEAFLQSEESFTLGQSQKKRTKKVGLSYSLESWLKTRVSLLIAADQEISEALKELVGNSVQGLGAGKSTLDEALERVVEEGSRALLDQVIKQTPEERSKTESLFKETILRIFCDVVLEEAKKAGAPSEAQATLKSDLANAIDRFFTKATAESAPELESEQREQESETDEKEADLNPTDEQLKKSSSTLSSVIKSIEADGSVKVDDRQVEIVRGNPQATYGLELLPRVVTNKALPLHTLVAQFFGCDPNALSKEHFELFKINNPSLALDVERCMTCLAQKKQITSAEWPAVAPNTALSLRGTRQGFELQRAALNAFKEQLVSRADLKAPHNKDEHRAIILLEGPVRSELLVEEARSRTPILAVELEKQAARGELKSVIIGELREHYSRLVKELEKKSSEIDASLTSAKPDERSILETQLKLTQDEILLTRRRYQALCFTTTELFEAKAAATYSEGKQIEAKAALDQALLEFGKFELSLFTPDAQATMLQTRSRLHLAIGLHNYRRLNQKDSGPIIPFIDQGLKDLQAMRDTAEDGDKKLYSDAIREVRLSREDMQRRLSAPGADAARELGYLSRCLAIVVYDDDKKSALFNPQTRDGSDLSKGIKAEIQALPADRRDKAVQLIYAIGKECAKEALKQNLDKAAQRSYADHSLVAFGDLADVQDPNRDDHGILTNLLRLQSLAAKTAVGAAANRPEELHRSGGWSDVRRMLEANSQIESALSTRDQGNDQKRLIDLGVRLADRKFEVERVPLTLSNELSLKSIKSEIAFYERRILEREILLESVLLEEASVGLLLSLNGSNREGRESSALSVRVRREGFEECLRKREARAREEEVAFEQTRQAEITSLGISKDRRDKLLTALPDEIKRLKSQNREILARYNDQAASLYMMEFTGLAGAGLYSDAEATLHALEKLHGGIPWVKNEVAKIHELTSNNGFNAGVKQFVVEMQGGSLAGSLGWSAGGALGGAGFGAFVGGPPGAVAGFFIGSAAGWGVHKTVCIATGWSRIEGAARTGISNVSNTELALDATSFGVEALLVLLPPGRILAAGGRPGLKAVFTGTRSAVTAEARVAVAGLFERYGATYTQPEASRAIKQVVFEDILKKTSGSFGMTVSSQFTIVGAGFATKLAIIEGSTLSNEQKSSLRAAVVTAAISDAVFLAAMHAGSKLIPAPTKEPATGKLARATEVDGKIVDIAKLEIEARQRLDPVLQKNFPSLYQKGSTPDTPLTSEPSSQTRIIGRVSQLLENSARSGTDQIRGFFARWGKTLGGTTPQPVEPQARSPIKSSDTPLVAELVEVDGKYFTELAKKFPENKELAATLFKRAEKRAATGEPLRLTKEEIAAAQKGQLHVEKDPPSNGSSGGGVSPQPPRNPKGGGFREADPQISSSARESTVSGDQTYDPLKSGFSEAEIYGTVNSIKPQRAYASSKNSSAGVTVIREPQVTRHRDTAKPLAEPGISGLNEVNIASTIGRNRTAPTTPFFPLENPRNLPMAPVMVRGTELETRPAPRLAPVIEAPNLKPVPALPAPSPELVPEPQPLQERKEVPAPELLPSARPQLVIELAPIPREISDTAHVPLLQPLPQPQTNRVETAIYPTKSIRESDNENGTHSGTHKTSDQTVDHESSSAHREKIEAHHTHRKRRIRIRKRKVGAVHTFTGATANPFEGQIEDRWGFSLGQFSMTIVDSNTEEEHD